MTMRQGTCGLVLALAFVCFSGCRERWPLPRPIPCEGVVSLKLGDTRAKVEQAIGPALWLEPIERPLIDGTKADEYASYTYLRSPDLFEFWDHLDVYYLGGRLVFVGASRRLGGKARARAETDTLLAFRLTRQPDAPEDQSMREIGPAFEDVFQCEPGFRRPVR